MSNNYFKFKQFTVWHDRCAMKVGTDGTLLGAWAPVNSVRSVLDIGTGTGLIALMIAQRQPLCRVNAIDIDAQAVEQAMANVAESPFHDRIKVNLQDITLMDSAERYDLIVCNPPFFQDSLRSPSESRSFARHNVALSFDMLCRKAYDLLHPEGLFCVVIPTDVRDKFVREATGVKLFVTEELEVCTKKGKHPKRVLLAFGKRMGETPRKDILYMMDEHGMYTGEYRQLTGDFYLK